MGVHTPVEVVGSAPVAQIVNMVELIPLDTGSESRDEAGGIVPN